MKEINKGMKTREERLDKLEKQVEEILAILRWIYQAFIGRDIMHPRKDEK